MQVTITGYLHAHQTMKFDAEKQDYVDETVYEVFPFDFSQSVSSRVLIGEQHITVNVPDNFDIRTGLVANLEREKRDLQAEFGKRITKLNEQINSLLAIEG